MKRSLNAMVLGLGLIMAQLLESDLIEAMNRLEALGHHLRHSPVREAFKRLEGYVEEFEIESALKTLDEIAKGLE